MLRIKGEIKQAALIVMIYCVAGCNLFNANCHIKLYDDLVFCSIEDVCSKDNFESKNYDEKKDIIEWLKLMGLKEERALIEYHDPFFSDKLVTLTLTSCSSAKTLVEHFTKQFRECGWETKRNINMLEYTNGGGDWLRVYSKDDKEVLIHIIGSWTDNQIEVGEGYFRQRTVIFRFLNCRYEEVFGANVISNLKHISINDARRVKKIVARRIVRTYQRLQG